MAGKAAKASKPKEKKKIGEVLHYYTNIGVAVVKLNNTLKAGDRISVKGATTDFEQSVDSMQINHKNVEEAKKGQEVGMKVADKVREGDCIYKA